MSRLTKILALIMITIGSMIIQNDNEKMVKLIGTLIVIVGAYVVFYLEHH